MTYSLALHLIGLVLWIGGLVLVPRMMRLTLENRGGMAVAVRRVFWGYLIPGFVLTLITGLYQFDIGGRTAYFSQGWFHGKLLFLVVLVVITVLLATDVKRYAGAERVSPGRLMAIHGTAALSLILIMILMKVMRA